MTQVIIGFPFVILILWAFKRITNSHNYFLEFIVMFGQVAIALNVLGFLCFFIGSLVSTAFLAEITNNEEIFYCQESKKFTEKEESKQNDEFGESDRYTEMVEIQEKYQENCEGLSN